MTPTQRAAAERLAKYWSADDWPGGLSGKKMDETAALLRELLAAEPAQEPVAWGVFVDDELFKPFNCKDEAVDWFQAQYNHGSRYDFLVLPLYTAPQQRRPPSDEFVSRVVRSVQPNLDVRCKAWAEQFDECKHWLDAAYGITGEPT